MKNLVKLLATSLFVVGLNSSAFAGYYQVVYDMDAHHDVTDYKVVNTSCSKILNGPAGAFDQNTWTQSDPTNGIEKQATSSADFVWVPAYQNETPASYYYSQDFSCSVALSATRPDPLSGGYAQGQVSPGYSLYTVDAQSSNPNNDDAPLSYNSSTGYHVESGTITGQSTAPFTKTALIGAYSFINGRAMHNGTIYLSSSVQVETLSIDIHQ